MKTLKIHLIRHGATDANFGGLYVGSKTDLPLAPEGLYELRFLKENNDYPNVDVVYSSPLMRCRQTAAVLYPDHDVIPIDNLKEYDFGSFEGKNAYELEGDPDFAPWTSGKISAPPDGEENSGFVKRICTGFGEAVTDMLEKGYDSSAIIMHGGVIMMLLASIAVPRRKPIEWLTDNGRGYSLLITPSLYLKSGVAEVYDIV